MRRFFGKYRGKVTSNLDPLQLGRVQVSVPAIFGSERLSWAMPCTPYAGKGVGWFAVPPLNANVWVEFEGGDPDYPIWTGCFWEKFENPAQPLALPTTKMLKTEGFKILINDAQGIGKLSIESLPEGIGGLPLKVELDATQGVEINTSNIATVKVKPNEIEIKIGETSVLKLLLQSIELKEGAVSVKLSLTGIDLTSPPATMKLSTTAGIDMDFPPASLKVSSTGVEITAAAASAKVAPATVELNNAAASVKLSPLSVNVNNGALEVI